MGAWCLPQIGHVGLLGFDSREQWWNQEPGLWPRPRLRASGAHRAHGEGCRDRAGAVNRPMESMVPSIRRPYRKCANRLTAARGGDRLLPPRSGGTRVGPSGLAPPKAASAFPLHTGTPLLPLRVMCSPKPRQRKHWLQPTPAGRHAGTCLFCCGVSMRPAFITEDFYSPALNLAFCCLQQTECTFSSCLCDIFRCYCPFQIFYCTLSEFICIF